MGGGAGELVPYAASKAAINSFTLGLAREAPGEAVLEPRPVQRPLSVWVGGNGRAALRRAATFGEGWHPIDVPPADLRGGMRTLRALCGPSRTPPALCPRYTVRVLPHAAGTGRRFMEGDAPQLADDLLALHALGAAHVVLSTQTDDPAGFRREIETLGRDVVPAVRAAISDAAAHGVAAARGT